MTRKLSASVLLLVVLAAQVAADQLPWRRRRRPEVEVNHRATSLVLPSDWPEEPVSPSEVDRERLARAIREICGWMPPSRPQAYADLVLQNAREFDIDPFLLAGMMHRLGRCLPDTEDMGGQGLTLIPRRMYDDGLRGGVYTYYVRSGAAWAPRTLRLDRFPFSEHRLLQAEPNLYFAAGFLRAWRDQAESLAEAYDQAPHRHYVSHFVWGDKVISDRAEDRILLDRRRLLEYYGARARPAPIARLGLQMGSPLDGAPRVVSSWLGAERDGGERNHRGIDVESVLGEPVRAVADGRVNFAGVDLPGSRNSRSMSKAEIEAVPRHTLGRGGRYVCIFHDIASGGWLRTCYMHLEDVDVSEGQVVRRGDRIGTVGRTGMLRSAPHLHLELHSPEGILDGSQVLSGFLLGRNPDPPEPRRRRTSG